MVKLRILARMEFFRGQFASLTILSPCIELSGLISCDSYSESKVVFEKARGWLALLHGRSVVLTMSSLHQPSGTGQATPSPSPSPSPSSPALSALEWLRLLQPLVILLVLLLSIVLGPSKKWISSTFRRNQYAQLTFDDEEAVAVSAEAQQSAVAAQPTIPEPTPVIVPVRSRRRVLTIVAIVALAASYLLSGLLITLRAVIPVDSKQPNSGRTWTPDLPLWRNSHLQALLGVIAWNGVAILMLLEERKRGKQGSYGRGKAAWSMLAGISTDIAIFVLYFVIKGGRRTLPDTSAWTIAQLCIIVSRLLLGYPALLVGICWEKVKFIRAADLQQQREEREQNEASQQQAGGSSTPANNDATERSGLLSARAAPAAYGSTNATPIRTPNNATPPNGPAAANGKLPDGRTPGQADLGLSVSAPPPPPTFNVFAQRIVKLFPYLWPTKSAKLQGLAVICGAALLVARVVNLLVPLTLGSIIQDLGSGTPPWWHIFMYTVLKLFQGSSGVLSFIQRQAWIPVMQYSDRMMSMMAFEHLLNLSVS